MPIPMGHRRARNRKDASPLSDRFPEKQGHAFDEIVGFSRGRFLMKQLAFAGTLLLLCISFPTSLAARNKVPRYLNKESSVDMSNRNRVFVGWIDSEPDAWALYGFASRTDWTNVIGSLNATFARGLQGTCLPGRA